MAVSGNIAKLDQTCLKEWAEGANSWLSGFAGTQYELWLHGGIQQECDEKDMDSNTLEHRRRARMLHICNTVGKYIFNFARIFCTTSAKLYL